MNDPNEKRKTQSTQETRWPLIEAKMRKARSVLETGGSLHRRHPLTTRSLWELRYRETVDGKSVNRAIYIGEDALADRVRALLDRWREPVTNEHRHQQRVMDDYMRLARAREYSGRAEKRLEKAAKESFKDPRIALRFAIGLRRDDAAIRYGDSPGRPRRSALW